MDEAKAAYCARQYADAAALFETAARSSPDDALAAYNNRAAALLELGRYSEAAGAAQAALGLDGGSVKAHYRYAKALDGMGDHSAACLACERALVLSPANAQLLELQAACRLAAGPTASPAVAAAGPRPGEGAAAASSLEPLREHDERCEAEADRAMAMGEFGQAVAWYTHAIKAVEEGAPQQCGGADRGGPGGGGSGGGGASDGGGGGGSGASGGGGTLGWGTALLASLLSRRAAALLSLGRHESCARDCERAAALDACLIEPRVTGAAALMQVRTVVSSRCHTYIPIHRVLFPPTTSHSWPFLIGGSVLQASTHEVVGSTSGPATFPFAVCDTYLL